MSVVRYQVNDSRKCERYLSVVTNLKGENCKKLSASPLSVNRLPAGRQVNG